MSEDSRPAANWHRNSAGRDLPASVAHPEVQNENLYTNMERLVQANNIAIYTPLSVHHNKTMDKFQSIQSQLESMSRTFAAFREEAKERTDVILSLIQQSHEAQNAKIKFLRADIGSSETAPGLSLSERLAGLEMRLQAMAECVRDPPASAVRHEIGTSPHTSYDDPPVRIDEMSQTESASSELHTSTVVVAASDLGTGTIPSKCCSDAPDDVYSTLFASDESPPLDQNKSLDQLAADLNLSSFVNEPIFRPELINPSYLSTLHSRFAISPNLDPLVPVSWSYASTADNTPQSSSLLAHADNDSVMTLRRQVLGPQADFDNLTPPSSSPPKGELVLPPYDPEAETKTDDFAVTPSYNKTPPLPSPPITRAASLNEEGSGPSGRLSSLCISDRPRSASPASTLTSMSSSSLSSSSPSLSSLSPLSPLSNLSDCDSEETECVAKPFPAEGVHLGCVNPRHTISVPPNQDQNTPDGKRGKKKRRSDGTDVPGPSKRRKNSKKAPKTMVANPEKGLARNSDWPPVMSSNHVFHRQLIQCDNCDVYYHYGCVGIVEGDRRAEPDELFFCPPCSSVSEEQRLWRRSASGVQRANNCGRSDCDQTCNDDEFFVERIIGRRPRLEGGGYDWLIKWDGYPVKDATWSREEDIGGADKLIEEFEHVIQRQTLPVLETGVVLFKEAVDGGWTA